MADCCERSTSMREISAYRYVKKATNIPCVERVQLDLTGGSTKALEPRVCRALHKAAVRKH